MINLLPYKEKKSIEKVRGIRFTRTIVGGFILVELAAVVLLVPTLITINSRFNIAANQIKSLESNGSMASDIDIASLAARAQVVQSKLSVAIGAGPTEYIDIVKAIIPSGISVDRFAVNEEKILEVSGTAQSREVLQSFVEALQKNEKVATVDSPVSNFIKNSNSLFKIKVSFK